LFTEIIMGKLPIEAFDDYVARWNAQGGAELEKNANRMYRYLYD
jgi:putative aldouronate transport system substrate-binding protein